MVNISTRGRGRWPFDHARLVSLVRAAVWHVAFVALVQPLAAQNLWEPLHDPGVPAQVLAWSPQSGFAAATYSSDYGPGGRIYRYDSGSGKWMRRASSPFVPFGMMSGRDGRIRMVGRHDEWDILGSIYVLDEDLTGREQIATFTDRYPYCMIQTGEERFFIGTTRGVMESVDGGRTWSQLGPDEWRVYALNVLNDKLLVGTSTGLLTLEADGKWRRIGPDNLVIGDLASREDDGFLVATNGGLYSVASPGFVLTATDWTGPVPYVLEREESGRIWLGTLVEYESGTTGPYRSDDGGLTWVPEDDLMGHSVYEIASGDGTVAITTAAGMAVRGQASGAWTFSGVSNSIVDKLQFTQDGTLVADHGNYGGLISISGDKGESWKLLDRARGYLLARDGSILLFSSDWIKAYSTSGRLLWRSDAYITRNVTWLAEDLDGWMYAGGNSPPIVRSPDRGTTWQTIEQPAREVTRAIPAPDGSVWFWGREALYRSTDQGSTMSSLGDMPARFSSFVMTSRYNVYATAGRSLWRGYYAGGGWAFWDKLLDSVNSPKIVELDDASLVMSDHFNGFSFSSDAGYTWTSVYARPSHPDFGIWTMRSFAVTADGVIFAGTFGDGVFRSTYSIFSSTKAESEPSIPRAPTVSVFPNPTSGRITIGLDWPTTDSSTLTVYDPFGRQVRSRTLVTGGQTIDLDTGSFAPGAYFYRIRSGTTSTTGSFVVVR